jgi:hypothetical protein
MTAMKNTTQKKSSGKSIEKHARPAGSGGKG